MNQSNGEKIPGFPTLINAFQLIGMSSYLDLSGFFEKEVSTPKNISLLNSNMKIYVALKLPGFGRKGKSHVFSHFQASLAHK